MLVTRSANNYDLSKTLECGQVFRYSKTMSGEYIVHSKDKACCISQKQDILQLSSEEKDVDYWWHYFAVDAEYANLEEVMSGNRTLRGAYEHSMGLRILRQDPWECLISFIISQQKRIPQIQECIELLCKAGGKKLWDDSYAFPEPRLLIPEVVCKAHLGYRADYVLNVAKQVSGGYLVLSDYTADKVSYTQAMTKLLGLYGVGSKVANCVALFSLGFTNAFPIDTHIRKIMELKEMQGFDPDKCGEYAGIVQQYLFNYALYVGL